MTAVNVFQSEQFNFVQAVAPAGNRTTTQTSAAIDTHGFDRLRIDLTTGTITDGTYTLHVLTGDTPDAVTTDLGSFATLTASHSTSIDVDLRHLVHRWVKVQVVASGSPATGAIFAASVALRKRPR